MASNSSSSIRLGSDYLWLGSLIILSIVGLAQSVSIKTVDDAKHYLFQYGYFPSGKRSASSSSLVDFKTWRKSISNFQKFAGLNVTGKLDAQTLQKMSQPRCGVSDAGSIRKRSRAKRYVLEGSSWPKKNLTYKVENFPKNMKPSDAESEIAKAFNAWSTVADITFSPETYGPVDIHILFLEGNHEDNYNFDGPGGVLAHAYFPQHGGATHFDRAENWSLNVSEGKSLFRVALHEFGHVLGLTHSENVASVMAPFYRGEKYPKYKLEHDDIMGVQALYGKPVSAAPRTDRKDGYYPQTRKSVYNPHKQNKKQITTWWVPEYYVSRS